MHKIDNILTQLCAQPWAIMPGKLEAILEFLSLRATGVDFSAEEIAARVGPERAAPPQRVGAVAVLPLHGLITHRLSAVANMSGPGSTSTLDFGAAFDSAVAREDIDSILIDVDSPGGTVTGTNALAGKIFAARGTKPIVAISHGMMASAAYYIASAADEIVQTADAFTGSIGVYTVHVDRSGMDSQMGIKRTIVSAGKHKAEGSDTAPLSDEARDGLQRSVDQAYDLFVSAVARHRGVSAAEVRDGFGEGRAVFGKEAVEVGLADRVATFEETVDRLANRRRAAHVGRAGRHAATERRRLALKTEEDE